MFELKSPGNASTGARRRPSNFVFSEALASVRLYLDGAASFLGGVRPLLALAPEPRFSFVAHLPNLRCAYLPLLGRRSYVFALRMGGSCVEHLAEGAATAPEERHVDRDLRYTGADRRLWGLVGDSVVS